MGRDFSIGCSDSTCKSVSHIMFDMVKRVSQIKDVIEDKFRFGIEPNEYRAYDEIYEFLEEEFNCSDLCETVNNIIEGAKSISPNYVYACELIQWVENNLEDWCKERNINYEELFN